MKLFGGTIALGASAALIAGAVAACGSSSSAPATKTGTETITAVVSGSTAARSLNSNSNGPLPFTSATFAGPVNVTVNPFHLGGGANGKGKFTTPAGTLALSHQTAPGFGANSSPPVTWKKSGDACMFTATFSKGTFTAIPGESTGKFRGATGHGTFVITASGAVKLPAGKTSCAGANPGNVQPAGAAIKFTASGKITVKS